MITRQNTLYLLHARMFAFLEPLGRGITRKSLGEACEVGLVVRDARKAPTRLPALIQCLFLRHRFSGKYTEPPGLWRCGYRRNVTDSVALARKPRASQRTPRLRTGCSVFANVNTNSSAFENEYGYHVPCRLCFCCSPGARGLVLFRGRSAFVICSSMWDRSLATCPIPGDVACLLSRMGYTKQLGEVDAAHVARVAGPHVAAMATPSASLPGMLNLNTAVLKFSA